MGGAVTALLLSGCSSPFATVCPAVGWANTVEIDLVGSADALEQVGWVELCDEAGCSVSEEERQIAGESAPVESEPPYYTAWGEGAYWTVNLIMSAPTEVTVRAWSTEAQLLAEAESTLQWERTGGSEQCGGPVATDPVDLSLPG